MLSCNCLFFCNQQPLDYMTPLSDPFQKSFCSSKTIPFPRTSLVALLTFFFFSLDLFFLKQCQIFFTGQQARPYYCSMQWPFISTMFSSVCLLHGCSILAACSHPGMTWYITHSSATGISSWWTSHLSRRLSDSIFLNKDQAETNALQAVLWDTNLRQLSSNCASNSFTFMCYKQLNLFNSLRILISLSYRKLIQNPFIFYFIRLIFSSY